MRFFYVLHRRIPLRFKLLDSLHQHISASDSRLAFFCKLLDEGEGIFLQHVLAEF